MSKPDIGIALPDQAVLAGESIPGVGRMTVSVGVCDLAEADSAAELLRLADGALYWAKAQGRNLCLRYSPHTTRALSAEEHLSRLEHAHVVAGVRAPGPGRRCQGPVHPAPHRAGGRAGAQVGAG